MPRDPVAEKELRDSMTMIAAVVTHLGLAAGFGFFFSTAIVPLEGGWMLLAAAILPIAFFVSLAAYSAWATAARFLEAARRAARAGSIVDGLRWKGFEPPYPGSSLLVIVGPPVAAVGGAILGAVAGGAASRASAWYFGAGLLHGALALWFVRTRKPAGGLWGENELDEGERSHRKKNPPPA